MRRAEISAAEGTFSHRWNANSEVTGTQLNGKAGLARRGVSLVRIAPGKESFACRTSAQAHCPRTQARTNVTSRAATAGTSGPIEASARQSNNKDWDFTSPIGNTACAPPDPELRQRISLVRRTAGPARAVRRGFRTLSASVGAGSTIVGHQLGHRTRLVLCTRLRSRDRRASLEHRGGSDVQPHAPVPRESVCTRWSVRGSGGRATRRLAVGGRRSRRRCAENRRAHSGIGTGGAPRILAAATGAGESDVWRPRPASRRCRASRAAWRWGPGVRVARESLRRADVWAVVPEC